MGVGETILLIAAVITALGVIGGGIVFALKVLWCGATLVSETKASTEKIAECSSQMATVKDQITEVTTVLKDVRHDLQHQGEKLVVHGEKLGEIGEKLVTVEQRVDKHDKAIGILTVLNGLPAEKSAEEQG